MNDHRVMNAGRALELAKDPPRVQALAGDGVIEA
jgi:hypothetical protein